jgi:hypothetical protein
MKRSSGPKFLALLVMISIPGLLCSPAMPDQTSSQWAQRTPTPSREFKKRSPAATNSCLFIGEANTAQIIVRGSNAITMASLCADTLRISKQIVVPSAPEFQKSCVTHQNAAQI